MADNTTEQRRSQGDPEDGTEQVAPQWIAAAQGVTDDEGYLIGATRPSARLTFIQALRYAFFSASAAGIEFLLGILLPLLWRSLHIPGGSYWPGYLIALIVSIVWNFTINRSFNFKSVVNVRVAMTKVLVYYLFFTPLSTWWVNELTTRLHWNYTLVLIATIIINGATEFLVYRYAVFHRSMNTNKRGQTAQ